MKKLATLLAIVSIGCIIANAQTSLINVTGKSNTKICKTVAGGNGISCYKTTFAENFKVCKSADGYYICSEVPGYFNSTYLRFTGVTEYEQESVHDQYTLPARKTEVDDKTVPQSQSYVNTPAGSH